MPREGPIGPAFIYYMIIGVVAAGISLFWGSVFEFASLPEMLGVAGAGSMNALVEFLLSPLLLVITLYVITGITHLILSVMDGANNGFNTTLRVFAYSYSPALFSIIPLVGGLVGLVWMSVVSIIGLREAQETSGGKSATAVLAPLGCLFVLLTLVMMLAVAMGVLGSAI
jgi:hypothetical protein